MHALEGRRFSRRSLKPSTDRAGVRGFGLGHVGHHLLQVPSTTARAGAQRNAACRGRRGVEGFPTGAQDRGLTVEFDGVKRRSIALGCLCRRAEVGRRSAREAFDDPNLAWDPKPANGIANC
ncbi:MAG TPA: hypothetical protein VGB41_02305, partial [Acidimicrobiia bacterium]